MDLRSETSSSAAVHSLELLPQGIRTAESHFLPFSASVLRLYIANWSIAMDAQQYVFQRSGLYGKSLRLSRYIIYI